MIDALIVMLYMIGIVVAVPVCFYLTLFIVVKVGELMEKLLKR